MSEPITREPHWSPVHAKRGRVEVGWYRSRPARALETIESLALDASKPRIDAFYEALG